MFKSLSHKFYLNLALAKLEEAWQHSCQTPLFQVGTWLLAQSQ
ncbi:hypothetical protein [Phormidium nigroviride]